MTRILLSAACLASFAAFSAQAQSRPEDTEVWSPKPAIVTPAAAVGAPPSDAIVLFDGKNLDQWVSSEDRSPAAWTVADGSSAEAVAAYRKVSQELLDASFLAEIAIYWEQWATSAKLQGAGYTKRSELLLTDAWLAG